MTLGISLAIITVAVVALVVFLIITLHKINKILDKTSLLVDRLNQDLPPLITDLRNTSSNLNTISGTLAQGMQSATAVAAASADYFKSFRLFGTLFDIFRIIRSGWAHLRTVAKGAKRNSTG